MTWAATLLAIALLVDPAPARIRHRMRQRPAIAAQAPAGRDPLAMATALDVFATCLSAGMSTATAAAAAVPAAPPALAAVLRRASELLLFGADPAVAWTGSGGARIDALLRLARRSATSGAALASGVLELAAQSRSDAGDEAEAAAQRASVLIAGPLGVCYLPAFVCLGIVPVIVGLATEVFHTGLF